VIALVVVLSAGSIVFALIWAGSTGGAPAPPVARVSVAARTASWLASEVGRSAIVSCDQAMCRALESRGRPATSLLVLRPGSADPVRSAVLVVTPAVRSMLGSRVGAYAPAALARFGSGGSQIWVGVVAPRGAAAYDARLRADVRARRTSSSELLHSRRLIMTPGARRQLAAGQVDARLIVAMMGLAAQRALSIVTFGDRGPGATHGIPLRSMELAVPPPGPATGGRSAGQWIFRYLRAQRQYRPASIQRVRLANGQHVIRIMYTAPSPLGLLG
jgi:hypothetical protein